MDLLRLRIERLMIIINRNMRRREIFCVECRACEIPVVVAYAFITHTSSILTVNPTKYSYIELLDIHVLVELARLHTTARNIHMHARDLGLSTSVRPTTDENLQSTDPTCQDSRSTSPSSVQRNHVHESSLLMERLFLWVTPPRQEI